jgi:hypothetical protein
MKVREVKPDGVIPNTAFIELQMFAAGQTQVATHEIVVYGVAGNVGYTFPFNMNVSNGENQRTILLGDTGVFGGVTPDFSDPNLGINIPVAGGAVCFPDATPPDCVVWGAFTTPMNFPDPAAAANPIPGPILEGSSITRSIARGCPTLLEAADDTGGSAADFSQTLPTPRSNSTAPTEAACPTPPPPPQPIRCGGLVVTKEGSARANVIRGTAKRDVIAGFGGNDTIRGLGGKDVLCGGKGRDRLIGGKGRDRLLGGPGRDVCKGGPKRDVARKCEVKRAI